MRILVYCSAIVLLAEASPNGCSGGVDGGGNCGVNGTGNGGNGDALPSPAAVDQAFRSSYIVPNVIPASPSQGLYVSFGNIEVKYGNEICPTQTIRVPWINYNSNPRSLYTLLYINGDINHLLLVKPECSPLQWAVVNIPGTKINGGTALSPYVRFLPPLGMGYEQGVFLVYLQPRSIPVTTALISSVAQNIYDFNITDFTRRYRLGRPIAGNFFIARNLLCDSDENDEDDESDES